MPTCINKGMIKGEMTLGSKKEGERFVLGERKLDYHEYFTTHFSECVLS